MKKITISGIGVATSAIGSINLFGLPASNISKEKISRLESPTSWAVAAVHQAWRMARLDLLNNERIGLLYSSVWGCVTATVAYLESLHDADGRYASPRHFARSTYASPASTLGIEFQIHGPCETLCFDQLPICSGLDRARRVLATGRCDAVVVCWADDSAPIVAALARSAVEKLGLKEFSRFTDGPLGAGAVAMVVTEAHVGALRLRCCWTNALQASSDQILHPPYPTDGALALAAAMAEVAKGEHGDIVWTEHQDDHACTSLRISRENNDA